MATLLSKFADSFDDEAERDAIIDFISFYYVPTETEDPALAFNELLVKTENEIADMFVSILETGTGSYDNLKDYLVDKLVEDVNAVVDFRNLRTILKTG